MPDLIMFWDTETSGLPLFNDPSDDPRQPHVLELAIALTDMAGNEVDRFDSIIKPGVGCYMEPEALAAHGITLERARDEGMNPVEAVDAFLSFVDRAALRVGHNESFDRRIMRIACARHKGFKWEAPQPAFCTMYKSINILKLPPTERMMNAGFRSFKKPNLGECVQHFFGEPLAGAHRAMNDVDGVRRVFFHLTGTLGVPMFKREAA